MKNSRSRAHLRQLIRETLQPEAEKDDIYGEYLFGEERPDVFEEDTPEENDLAVAFANFFDGDIDAVGSKDIRSLVDLRKSGKYNAVLDVPQKFSRAYRIVEVDSATYPDLKLGEEKSSKRSISVFDKVSPLSLWQGRAATSWTVDPKAVERFLFDPIYGKKDTILILICDLSSTRENFMMDPDKFLKINEDYSWQSEIWQINKTSIHSAIAVNKKWFYSSMGNPYKKAKTIVDMLTA